MLLRRRTVKRVSTVTSEELQLVALSWRWVLALVFWWDWIRYCYSPMVVREMSTFLVKKPVYSELSSSYE